MKNTTVLRNRALGLLVVSILVLGTGVAHAVTTVMEVGAAYVDKGATARDYAGRDLSSQVQVSSSVNTSRLGTYTVTYAVSDQFGTPADPAVRTVQVVDTTKPVITLNGAASATIQAGSVYTDAGATASDNYDGNITSRIVQTGSVNTAVAGSYTLTFNVSDSSGNAAVAVSRTVTVTSAASSDTVKPVITLLGSSSVTQKIGKSYVDAGATASDNVDGNITSRIVKTSNVNTSWPGTYYVKYNVTDNAGNAAATVTRTVKVTFFAKTGEGGPEFAVTSPQDGAVYQLVPGTGKALITFAAYASGEVAKVEYFLDGASLGTSDAAPFARTVLVDAAAVGWGEHSVTAVAQPETAGESLTAESKFSLVQASPADDANGNGIPDNPFTVLAADGDSWVDASSNAIVRATRIEGSGINSEAQTPVVTSLCAPGNTAERVNVMVSPDLVKPGETGVLILSLADSLDALVGAAGTSLLQPLPVGAGLTPLGQYIGVHLLVSADGGATFDEIDTARLAANPIHVQLEGLDGGTGAHWALFKHETYVNSDPVSGVDVAAVEGAWSDAGVVGLVSNPNTVTAGLISLSVIAVYKADSSEQDNNEPGTGCAAGSLNIPAPPGGRGGDQALLVLTALVLALCGRRLPRLLVAENSLPR